MTVKCLFMCDSSPVLVIKVCMNESVLKSSIFEKTYKIKFYCEIITKLMKFLVVFLLTPTHYKILLGCSCKPAVFNRNLHT